MIKQKVFIPVSVEDELPDNGILPDDTIVGYINANKSFYQTDDNKLDNTAHWLKEQEGYFFTSIDLKNFLKFKIMDALDGDAIHAANSRSAQLESINSFVESINIK